MNGVGNPHGGAVHVSEGPAPHGKGPPFPPQGAADNDHTTLDLESRVEVPAPHIAGLLMPPPESSIWRPAIIVGAAVMLIKLAFVFRTLGEDDQGRLIMAAIEYSSHGADTPDQYGILTSPLWVATFAWIAKTFGNAPLLLLTNLGGWLSGGVATTLGFVLLRQCGATRAWAAAGAVACGLTPGTFYMSLYGYPSQYAMPLILGSAVAFAASVRAETGGGASFIWFGLAAVMYALLTTTKLDFALSGTLMLAVAVLLGKLHDRRTWMLPLVAIAGVAAVYGLTSIAANGQGLMGFLKTVNSRHPWVSQQVFVRQSLTVPYACGFGTLFLLTVALLVGLIRRGRRLETIQVAIAWVVAAFPLWVFWVARPPISSRHAAPGALVTALFAALLGSQSFRGVRYAPAIWLVALVAIGWPFGEPRYDTNYFPSGNLARMLYVNRKAFAVVDTIAQTIARSPGKNKVVIGPRRWDLFGGIDFVPAIEVAMSAHAWRVEIVDRAGDGEWQHVFIAEDGSKTWLHPHIEPQYAVDIGNAAFFSTTREHDLGVLYWYGLPVEVFDPPTMFEHTEPSRIYRLLE